MGERKVLGVELGLVDPTLDVWRGSRGSTYPVVRAREQNTTSKRS